MLFREIKFLMILSLLVTNVAFAKKRSSKASTDEARFQRMKANYLKTDAKPKDVFLALDRLKKNSLKADSADTVRLLEIINLRKMGLNVLAAERISRHLSSVRKPADDKYSKYWTLLKKIAQETNVQFVMDEIFTGMKRKDAKFPKGFGPEYFYYLGNYYTELNQITKAMASFEKVRLVDTSYLRSRYALGLLHYRKGKIDSSMSYFKTVLNSTAVKLNGASQKEMKQLFNYSKMALARIFYEKGEFKNSLKFYRVVDRDSNQYYSALFEQSWAFFMAGYPNHALGALHSVTSPFFASNFNPEPKILQSLVYYWMCDYKEATQSLAEFRDVYKPKMAGLNRYLKRRRLNSKHGYDLFENYISGVSANTLGLDRAVLSTASRDESLWYQKFQMAAIISDIEVMERLALGTPTQRNRFGKSIRRFLPSIKNRIGDKVIASLKSLQKQYERMEHQAEFLSIELLMSQKEQALGRELHASTKIDRVSKNEIVSGWSENVNSWEGGRIGEYWWDEIGFYIFDVKPQCNVH